LPIYYTSGSALDTFITLVHEFYHASDKTLHDTERTLKAELADLDADLQKIIENRNANFREYCNEVDVPGRLEIHAEFGTDQKRIYEPEFYAHYFVQRMIKLLANRYECVNTALTQPGDDTINLSGTSRFLYTADADGISTYIKQHYGRKMTDPTGANLQLPDSATWSERLGSVAPINLQ